MCKVADELKAYGLDKQKAEAFLCGVELGKRAFSETKAEEKRHCCNPRDLAEFMMPKLRYLNHELHKAMEITEEVLRHMIIRKGVC